MVTVTQNINRGLGPKPWLEEMPLFWSGFFIEVFMSKPFFYRINAADLLADAVEIEDDAERGRWVVRLAMDLVRADAAKAKSSTAKAMIEETDIFRKKKVEAGRKGGSAKAKASSAKAKASKPLASSSSSSSTEPIKTIVAYLNEKAGKSYKPSSAKTTSSINARLNDGFSVDDIKSVIDIKCSEWLNTDMDKYLRPETLFGAKMESYLQQMPQSKNTQSDYDNEKGEAIARQAAEALK